jgi:hypothetical protein
VAKLPDMIVALLRREDGLTDREITDRLKGHNAPQQPVNQACRRLEAAGILVRRRRADGLIGNHLNTRLSRQAQPLEEPSPHKFGEPLTEDQIKKAIRRWLEATGWEVKVAFGHAAGPDIDAHKGRERWLIEVKGPGKHAQMRVNYFLAILGEIIQKMVDSGAM